MGSPQLTCDEGACRHLAVVGACGGQGPDGGGAEGRPVPRRRSVGPRGEGLQERASRVRGSEVRERAAERIGPRSRTHEGITYGQGDSRVRSGSQQVVSPHHLELPEACVWGPEEEHQGPLELGGKRVTGVG